MLSSIMLDVLLLIILLMMIPLGFLRGGLREVCTAAGLLFGILLAGQWSEKWGSWISDRLDITEGTSQFIVAVVIVVLATGLVGYGGSAAFSYRPGPGGRMYGAYIALFNGIVFAGFLINTVVERVFEGDTPQVIERGFLSDALSAGFGWILLFGAIGIFAGTVFGMFVRERPAEDVPFVSGSYAPPPPASRQATQPTVSNASHQPRPDVSTQDTEVHPSAPVRIREVRHWEDAAELPPQPKTLEHPGGYSGGWRQTWPDPKGQGPALPWEERPAPTPPSPKRVSGTLKKGEQKPTNPRDVLRDWMKDEGSDSKH